MAGRSERTRSVTVRIAVVLAGVAAVSWFLPLFHIAPLDRPSAANASAAFDAKAAAAQLWRERILPATEGASDLARVAEALRRDPIAARNSLGKAAGVGVAYFFVRGSGRIVERERNVVRLAVDGTAREIVTLRIGPVFGNTVRDGTGLLDVNAFPALQEFNALSAELNAVVEKDVLPPLREKATVGAVVRFAGCAEAPESAAAPGESLFTIVPLQAEVR